MERKIGNVFNCIVQSLAGVNWWAQLFKQDTIRILQILTLIKICVKFHSTFINSQLIWLKGKISLSFSKETFKLHKCLATIKGTWEITPSPPSVLMQELFWGGISADISADIKYFMQSKYGTSPLCISDYHYAIFGERKNYSSYYIFSIIYYSLVHPFTHTYKCMHSLYTNLYILIIWTKWVDTMGKLLLLWK